MLEDSRLTEITFASVMAVDLMAMLFQFSYQMRADEPTVSGAENLHEFLRIFWPEVSS
jgi:hypothetical protein